MKEIHQQDVIDSNLQGTALKGKHGKLPNALKVFIFGVIAINTSFFLVGIVFAIIALVKEKPDMKNLTENYEYYKFEKWKLIVGKSLSWAAFGMAVFYWLYFTLIFSQL